MRKIHEAAGEAQRKLDAIRHHLRGENWFGGETPKQYQPILDILDGAK